MERARFYAGRESGSSRFGARILNIGSCSLSAARVVRIAKPCSSRQSGSVDDLDDLSPRPSLRVTGRTSTPGLGCSIAISTLAEAARVGWDDLLLRRCSRVEDPCAV